MVILEGKNMLSEANFHAELKSKLELPDYYGENLDALWDCLTGWVDTPLEVRWNDFYLVKKSLGDYATKTLKLFQEAEGITVIISDK